MLYIVATPIGNLGDITLRAIEVLKSCDFVIAENPSYSRRLLDHIASLSVIARSASARSTSSGRPESDRMADEAIYEDEKIASDALAMTPMEMDPGPPPLHKATADLGQMHSAGMETKKKQMVQLAEHNEQQIVKELARRLIKETACLITDAGTPAISDPGFRLVRECVAQGVQVVPVPGANAAITALSASGLPTDRFMFLGFLQKTAAKTLSALEAANQAEATAIFYESPERIIKTLSYIANAYPNSHVVAARELTKLHEEFLRGNPLEVLEQLKNKSSIKGEFTVLVSFKN